MAAPDVPEACVAVDFPEDPHFYYHVRMLLVRLGDGSRWICSTPTWSVQVIDLAEHHVVALGRGAPYPPDVRGNVFGFVNITDAKQDPGG